VVTLDIDVSSLDLLYVTINLLTYCMPNNYASPFFREIIATFLDSDFIRLDR